LWRARTIVADAVTALRVALEAHDNVRALKIHHYQ
jgi:hypothetical protein